MKFWTLSLISLLFASVSSAQTDSIPKTPISTPKLKLSGSIRLEGGLFESSRNPSRMPNQYYTLAGNPRLTFGDWDIPMDFQIGNYANSLLQPFNKFGLSPSYKWIKLHLGYRQLNFSPFTLSNHVVLGAGVELDPGKLRFTALVGELKRQSSGGFFDNGDRYAIPSYKRMGVMTKLGAGSDDRFVDFIVLRAWDERPDDFVVDDSLGVAPEENLVFGLHIEQLIAQKLRLKLSGALSAYTLDTRSSLIEFDPYFGSELVNDIYKQRISTQYLGAGLISATYREKLWQADAEYSIAQPDFKSMGVYFNQSDLQRFSIGARAQLLKKRLAVSLSWRRENNNILDNKSSENIRQFWNGNVKWIQKRSWTATFNGSYFNSVQNVLNSDALIGSAFEQTTIQGIWIFMKRRANGSQHFSGQFSAMNRRDKIANQNAYANMSFRGSYTIPINGGEIWNFVPELGLTRFVILERLVTYRINPIAKFTFRSKNKSWDANASTAPQFEIKDVGKNQTAWRSSLYAGYRIKRKHRFSLRVDYSISSGGYSYDEFRAKLAYRYSL